MTFARAILLSLCLAAFASATLLPQLAFAQSCTLIKPLGHPFCRACQESEYGIYQSWRKKLWNNDCDPCTGKFCGETHPESNGENVVLNKGLSEITKPARPVALLSIDRQQFTQLARVNPNAAVALLNYRYDGDAKPFRRAQVSLYQGVVVQTRIQSLSSAIAQFDWLENGADHLLDNAEGWEDGTAHSFGEEMGEEAAIVVLFEFGRSEGALSVAPAESRTSLVIRTLLETPGGVRTTWAPTLVWPLRNAETKSIDFGNGFHATILALDGEALTWTEE